MHNDELLYRIDERLKNLEGDIQERRDFRTKILAIAQDTVILKTDMNWLTWGFRGMYAGVIYVLACMAGLIKG